MMSFIFRPEKVLSSIRHADSVLLQCITLTICLLYVYVALSPSLSQSVMHVSLTGIGRSATELV